VGNNNLFISTAGAGEVLKANVNEPIKLVIHGDLDTTSVDAYKDKYGYTYIWDGQDMEVISVKAKQSIADTGASQGIVLPTIDGNDILSTGLPLSGSDDTQVAGTLHGTQANLQMSAGDALKLPFTKGTNGDGNTMEVSIYFKLI